VEKQFQVPHEGMSPHQIAVGHMTIVDVTPVPVVLFNNMGFHGTVAVFTKLFFTWWWFDVSQHVYFSSVETNAVKPTLVLTLMPPLFSFSCFGPKSGAFLFCWAVLSCMNLFYVFPSHKEVLGMKRNCP